MSKFLYYNTLYQITTDGKRVWSDKESSDGFIPKDRAMIYYKINGKLLSSRQVFDKRFLVWVKEEPLPF